MLKHTFSYMFIILLLGMTSLCHAKYIDNIDLLSLQNYQNNKAQMTASYSILADTTFTENMATYNYGKYQLKVLNADNPHAMIFEVTENAQPLLSYNENAKLKISYPWWSTMAPKEIQNLDYSKVDGLQDIYAIGENYRLRLLSRQGHWGRVYALERLTPNSNVTEIIFAVKILLSRSDRDMNVDTFRERHQKEIQSNIILDDLKLSLAIKPYGILRNDEDHYLLFMEYGENAQSYFKKQPLEPVMELLYAFMDKIDQLHNAGYIHGDLKIDNMLLVGNNIKLCDWFTLENVNHIKVNKYRYIGDNLPPEAMRVLYFGDKVALEYALVKVSSEKAYVLHPIAADRFCLAISLLELLAPNLYQQYEHIMPKDFNPWKPDSLTFWQKHVDYLSRTQAELLKRAVIIKDTKKRQLFEKLAQYIDVDPMRRNIK